MVRLRFDATVEGEVIRDERIEFEVVPWNDYREGPARRWKDVPWVAYRHWLSKEKLQQIEDENLAQTDERDEAVEGEVWEIWCKDTGRGGSLSYLGFHSVTRPKSYHLKKV